MFIKKWLLKHPEIYHILYYLYVFIFHHSAIEHVVNKANTPQKYYIIRPRTNGIEGLMSIFNYIMQRVDYAYKQNLIPVVDMKNYYTQYYIDNKNSWELFFSQPSSATLDMAYNNYCIISGEKLVSEVDTNLFSKAVFFNKDLCKYCYSLVQKYVSFSEDIKNSLNTELKKVDVSKCIGIYMRGTDYTKMKPPGEPIQPSQEMVIEKVIEFKNKYQCHDLFLVTEDYDNYQKMVEKFGNEVHIASFDHFIKDYSGDDFLSKTDCLDEDVYQRGKEYLLKILMLSKCKYFISSITQGSISAYLINGGKFFADYIFELGTYE